MLNSKEVITKSLHESGINHSITCTEIYHYTSLVALKNILLGETTQYTEFVDKDVESQSNRLYLHCTHTDFVNDSGEIKYAWEPIKEALCELINFYNEEEKKSDSLSQQLAPRNLIEEVLFRLALSLENDEIKRQEIVNHYNKVYEKFPTCIRQIKEYKENFLSYFYIACFSELNDDLSQWRGYGDNAQGVCIEYSVDALKTHFTHSMQKTFVQVLYKSQDDIKENIKKLINCIFKEISINPQSYRVEGNNIDADMMFSLFEMLITFKNPSYAAEKEIRFFVQKVIKDDFSGISFKERQKILTPYMSFAYPASAITKVTIGPKADFRNNALALEMIKKKKELGFKIEQSKISYR